MTTHPPPAMWHVLQCLMLQQHGAHACFGMNAVPDTDVLCDLMTTMLKGTHAQKPRPGLLLLCSLSTQQS